MSTDDPGRARRESEAGFISSVLLLAAAGGIWCLWHLFDFAVWLVRP